MSKLFIKGILEKLDKLSKSNKLRYMTNGTKNKKTKFCRILISWFVSLAVGYKIHHCNNFYWVVFIRLTLFCSIVWIKKLCIILLKTFVSMFSKEKGKDVFHFSWQRLQKGKRWFITYSTYLEPQEEVIFGINQKPAEDLESLFLWSWGTPPPITHMFGDVCHHILKKINNFVWRQEVCPLNPFSYIKYLG